MASGIQYSFERVEKKYMLTRTQRDALLSRIGSHLEADAHPTYTICNIYYDTNDMEIKLPGVCPLWLGRALSELSIYPTSFSKYGACYQQYLLPQLQNNRWEDMFCA